MMKCKQETIRDAESKLVRKNVRTWHAVPMLLVKSDVVVLSLIVKVVLDSAYG